MIKEIEEAREGGAVPLLLDSSTLWKIFWRPKSLQPPTRSVRKEIKGQTAEGRRFRDENM